MSSRKRQICSNNISPELPSKRARLLSTLWKAEKVENGKEDTTIDTTFNQDLTQCGHRKVRAIIGENSQDLIDWEGSNNKKSKPSWKAKEYIDESAVTNWTQENLSLSAEGHNPSQKRRREGSVEQTSNHTTPDRFVRLTSSTTNRPHRVRATSLSGFVERDRKQTNIARSTVLSTTPSPNFAVKVSRTSSLDKDQYIRYTSSLSTQGLPSSLPPNQYSELGSPLPSPEGLILTQGIVPDSQSLPGSSSYVPTSSTSANVTSSSWSAQDHSIIHTGQATRLEAESSSLRDSEVVFPVEITTSLFGTGTSRSEQSTSISQISSTISSAFSIRAANLTYVSRTGSDPSSTILTGLAHTSTQAVSNIVSSSVLEIPASSTESSCSGQVPDTHSPENLQPVASVPIHLGSQGTEKSSSVDNWQSGQQVLVVPESLSQISSENSGEISFSSVEVRETYRPAPRETAVRRRFAIPETFVISEDHIDDTQTSSTTEGSILSQRDPNSQPEKPLERTEPQDFPSSFTALLSDSKMAEQIPSQLSTPSEGALRNLSAGPPQQSLREKLLNLRAAGRASLAVKVPVADQEDLPKVTASPTRIPPKLDPPISNESHRIEVQPLKIAVELPLPVRAVQSQPNTPAFPSQLHTIAFPSQSPTPAFPSQPPTPVFPSQPHTPAFPSRLAKSHSFSQRDVFLKLTNLGESEYVISLPMNTRVRDQYISTINYYRKTIEDCMKIEEPDEQLKKEIGHLLFRVNAVTTHVDLDCKATLRNGRYTLSENEESPADEAKWAENCSAKFQFLGHLLEATRNSDMSIVIVATSDHLLDIIKTFLKGKEVAYTQPDAETRPSSVTSHSERPVTRGRLVVTLLCSTDDTLVFSRRRANLVIAFDVYFNIKSRKVMSFREGRDGRANGELAPVIHLLVHGSGEHIERCLPNDLDSWVRVRHIVSYITQTRHRVGQLSPDEIGPRVLAEEVAEFVKAGGLDKDWALPSIRAIDGLEIIEPHSFESSSFQTTQSSDQPSTVDIMGRTSATPKRSIDTEAKTSASKKQKSTSANAAQRQKSALADLTHVSDSILDTQSAGANRDELVAKIRHELQEALLDLDAEKLSHRSDRAGMEHYQRETQDKLAAEKKAHERTEKERQEIVGSLSDLQTRMEDKTKQFRTLRHEKEELGFKLATTLEKTHFQSSEISLMKIHRAQLELELKRAHETNKASSNPNVAELENLHDEIRKLKTQNVVLEKKVASHATDLDYARAQYQTASTAAVEATKHVSQLEKELAAMTIKAKGEATRLAQINQTNAIEQANAEVDKLQMENQTLETMLRRKEEELRELKRGRGGAVTRGSSVGGKSPRGGSRAGSPGPGPAGFGAKVGGSALRFS